MVTPPPDWLRVGVVVAVAPPVALAAHWRPLAWVHASAVTSCLLRMPVQHVSAAFYLGRGVEETL